MKPGILLVLLILVAVPYVTGLNHGFVYDDTGSVADNPFLTSYRNIVPLMMLRTVADSRVSDGRRPMVILTYFSDRAVWGLTPFGYHFTNLLLHLGVVALVLLLARRLAGSAQPPFLAVAAALIFGLHPVLTEAVQVPAFREDLLFTAFALLYALAGTTRSPLAWLSVPALFLGLMSKESAAVAPLLLAWLWLCFPEQRLGRRTSFLLLGTSLALVAVFVALWMQGGSLQAASIEWKGLGLAFPANLLTAPWLWVKALRLLAWPWPLIADRVVVPVSRVTDPRFAAGVLAIGACIAAAALLRRRAAWPALALGWILIAFLPVANLIPLYNPFAERYLYFPAIGFALGAAWLLSRLPSASPHARALRAAALAVLCAVYGTATIRRLPDWASNATLWTKTLTQEPRSARAHTWVGLGMKKNGDILAALKHFEEADRLYPGDISALINIAILYGEQGRYEDAEKLLREAIQRRPNKADAHWNLAVALQGQNRMDEVMEEVQKTLQLDPFHGSALAAREFLTGTARPPPNTPTIPFEGDMPATGP